MAAVHKVKDAELDAILMKFLELRRWQATEIKDIWAWRQALLMILELNTQSALKAGLSQEYLERFDTQVKTVC